MKNEIEILKEANTKLIKQYNFNLPIDDNIIIKGDNNNDIINKIQQQKLMSW
jgi:hypothetical protein